MFKFDGISGLIAGGFGGAVIGGMLCWQVAFDRGEARGTKTERENAKQVTSELITKLNIANAQVAKANEAHANQVEKLAADFLSENAARATAQASLAQEVKASNANARVAIGTISELRAAIKVSLDTCTAAGVDPSIIELFNRAVNSNFTPTTGSIVSATGGH